MLVDKSNITALIPQRSPFVMIDQLLWNDETTTRTSFRVTEENIFFAGGELGEPALVENIAQTAAARAGFITTQHNLPVLVGYIGAIKDLEIFTLPKLYDTLETEITIKNQIFDVTVVWGTVKCNGNLLAQCEMKIFIIQPK